MAEGETPSTGVTHPHRKSVDDQGRVCEWGETMCALCISEALEEGVHDVPTPCVIPEHTSSWQTSKALRPGLSDDFSSPVRYTHMALIIKSHDLVSTISTSHDLCLPTREQLSIDTYDSHCTLFATTK